MPSHMNSRISGVTLRHSLLADAPAIMQLLALWGDADEGLSPPAAVRAAGVCTAEDLIDLIQTSFIAVTATVPARGSAAAGESSTGSATAADAVVVGFLAVGTGPRLEGGGPPDAAAVFPAPCWDVILHSGLYPGAAVETMQPSTTLWVSLYAAPSSEAVRPLQSAAADTAGSPASAYESGHLLRDMLAAVLGLSPQTANVLFALPNPTGESTATTAAGDLLRDTLGATVLQPAMSAAVPPKGFGFTGTLLHVRRSSVLPALVVRAGRMEDYDDFAPLLVRGDGVITGLPEDFFLEEILKDQDARHKVGVAEDPVTHEVVGLLCMHALSPEEQQAFARQYALEPFNKLRPLAPPGVAVPAGGGGGGGAMTTVRLDFVYYNRAYDGSAHELIEHVFDTHFPTCEYVLVTLPHAIREPPILRGFTYLPIRQYQPHNSRGEFVPVPEGLWACCRQSVRGLGDFRVSPVCGADDHAAVDEFLRLPALYDLSGGLADTLHADVRLSQEAAAAAGPQSGPLLRLMRGTATIGVASVRRLSSRDLYNLQANYDLEEYLSLYTHTGRDYTVAGDADEPPARKVRRLPPELHGILLRAVYVRPAFRTWVRFFLREVLRQCGADVVVTLAEAGSEPFAPLLRELVCARPRRVTETVGSTSDAPLADPSGEEEVGSPVGSAPGRDAAEAGETVGSPSVVFSATGAVAALASLHFTSARFLGDEKARVHTRVVVVGASATGLALLRSLVVTPFATLPNLVLISTDGLPPHPNQEPALWRADHMELREREYLTLQQGSPVRVVAGALVDLDKVNRFVAVDNGTFEPYDLLVLATGRQYVQPPPVRQLLLQEGRTGKKAVIALSGEQSLDRVRHALAEMDANQGNVANVMVYGSGLDALAVAAAMAQEGFSPQRTVVCARSSALPPGMDEATYHATATLFRSLGISVFRGYDVSRMEFDDGNTLTSVLLAPVSSESKAGQSVELACCLVVCVEDKDIDPHVLSALTKRSVVFDGRVIVNRRYRTTDPHILAAGPVAMWTRRYGTVTPNFEEFHAADVGSHLARVVLSRLGFDEQLRLAASDEGGAGSDDDDDEDDSDWHGAQGGGGGTAGALFGETAGGGSGSGAAAPAAATAGSEALSAQLRKRLPSYTTPIARRVRLPSGYHFFSVQRVGADLGESCEFLTCDTVDMDQFTARLGASSELPGTDDGTNGCASARASGSRQSVLTLYVHRHARRIDAVTYFGSEEPPTGNYSALVGLPETVLNLCFRYREAERRTAAFLASAEAVPGMTEREVNLRAHSGLTAGVRAGRLDLVQYLRLPHLQTILYDRFTSFFRRLARRVAAHEEAMRMRERILSEHRLDRVLEPEEIEAYQRELTARKSAFAYEVQLALIAFLHEQKNAQPRHLFLPNVERAVATRRGKSGAPAKGSVLDPIMMAR